MTTGNFGGGKGWFSGQPPQQNVESDFTPVDTFESDVIGMTPISPMDENSFSNPGLTPLNNFESDGMNITPIDNSQIENPFYGLLLFINILFINNRNSK